MVELIGKIIGRIHAELDSEGIWHCKDVLTQKTLQILYNPKNAMGLDAIMPFGYMALAHAAKLLQGEVKYTKDYYKEKPPEGAIDVFVGAKKEDIKSLSVYTSFSQHCKKYLGREVPHQFTVAIDFDQTIVDGESHDINNMKLIHGVKEAVEKFFDKGIRIIIWTCRDDLDEVANWLDENMIPYDYINNNPTQPTDSRKVMADVYIDDRTINPKELSWEEIAKKVLGEDHE